MGFELKKSNFRKRVIAMLDRFVQENIIPTEVFIRISTAEVYDRYLKFCNHYEMNPFGKREFYVRLERFGLIRSNGEYKGWFLKQCPY